MCKTIGPSAIVKDDNLKAEAIVRMFMLKSGLRCISIKNWLKWCKKHGHNCDYLDSLDINSVRLNSKSSIHIYLNTSKGRCGEEFSNEDLYWTLMNETLDEILKNNSRFNYLEKKNILIGFNR